MVVGESLCVPDQVYPRCLPEDDVRRLHASRSDKRGNHLRCTRESDASGKKKPPMICMIYLRVYCRRRSGVGLSPKIPQTVSWSHDNESLVSTSQARQTPGPNQGPTEA
ncbi:hypothetical protein PIB30_072365 [Stylosanthes scabra]|uniref:Uncharacterized protein n=1 Tax=Stylosanthes scabra TaxID=79078 RepID=A0ABU6XMJ4_9FABA|nr:hypothetical protein [Stylosanthes scabra]